MSPDIFKFKQFDVRQADGVMRINTDGVLLGAVCDVPAPERILDIGTGTGVVALMLAQRFPGSLIEAIDIDPIAVDCAQENFMNSSFKPRLLAETADLVNFSPGNSYDLIVSNPPYFINDLPNPDPVKRAHRHTDLSLFTHLFHNAATWLNDSGRFYVVWPPDVRTLLADLTTSAGLHPVDEIALRSFEGKSPFRIISGFSRSESSCTVSELSLYEKPGIYSKIYKRLLRDFLLPF